MKRLALLVSFALLVVVTRIDFATAYYLDTPHNESNGMDCSACHGLPPFQIPNDDYIDPQSGLPAPGWLSRAASNPEDTLANGVCLECHSESSTNPLLGPAKMLHSSSTTGSVTTWSTDCTQCHNPHFQGQLDWAAGINSPVFLATGTFQTTFGRTLTYVDPNPLVYYDEYTTIGLNSVTLVAQPGWDDVATWKGKGGRMDASRGEDGSRGLILVPNLSAADQTYEIIDVTTNVSGYLVIKVKGRMGGEVAFGGQTFGVIYGQAIRSKILPNGAASAADARDVKFFLPDLLTGSAGGYVDFTTGATKPLGLCQVCHDSTAFWKNDGSSNSHNNQVACGVCHNVLTGLAGGADHRVFIGDGNGCGTCHAAQAAAPETGHAGGCNTCHAEPKPIINNNILASDGGVSVRSALVASGFSFAPRLTDGNGKTISAADFLGLDCGSCHRLKPAALSAGDHGGHGAATFGWNSNCADCHIRTGLGVVKDLHDSSCTLCHEPALAAGGDYTVRIAGGSSHGVDGSAVGATAQAECTGCHNTSPLGAVHHDSRNGHAAAGRCTVCHAAAGHQGNHTGLVDDYPNCTTCHAANVGSSLGAPVNQVDNKIHDDCVTCHNSNTTLKELGQVNAARVVAMPAGGGTCAGCHAEYFPNHTNIDHQSRVGGSVACNSCHPATAGTSATAPVSMADNKIHDSCATCHLTNGVLRDAYGKAPGMAAGGGDCATCHGGYFPSHKITHETRVAGTGNCTGCHPGTAGLPGDMPVDPDDNKIHDGCAVCHDDGGNNLLKAAYGKASAMPPGGGDCNGCHGAYFVSHANADHTTRVAMNVSCAGCHEGTQGTATEVPVNPLNNMVHDACTTCHDAATGTLVGLAAGKTGGGDCLTCHLVSHDTNLDHNHRVTGGLVGNCLSCHAAGSQTAIDTLHGSCATCHVYGGGKLDAEVVASVISDGRGIGGVEKDKNCEACHGQHDSAIDHDNRQALPACAVCHASATATEMDLLHKNNCATCHGYAGVKLDAGVVAVAIATGKGATGTAVNCQTCHVAAAVSVIHHATEAAANGNCTIVCHQTVDHTATVKDAATSVCINCHTTTAGTATGAPVSLTDPAIHDSCFTCHKFDGNKRGILVSFTNSKGVNGTGTMPTGGTIGGKDGGGLCTACHTVADRKAYHHNSPRMAVGQCETCHVDPRPTWGAFLVGDNGVASGLPRPTQMPCIECHVDFTSSNMLIKKYTRSDYSSYRTDWTRTTIHTIPTTAMRINNYGICLSCHFVGSTKSGASRQMRLWHAQPSRSSPPWTFYNQTNSGTLGKTALRSSITASQGGDQAHYAPGRSANTTDTYPRSGIGGFNIFAPNYGLGSTDDHESYPGSNYAVFSIDSYNGPADDTPAFVRVAVPTVAQLADPLSATLNSTTRAVPVFASLAPQTVPPPLAADNVKVKSAVYDSATSTLKVVASTNNPDGCSTLKMLYGASNQFMTDAGNVATNCVKTISTVTYPYPAGGTTVDVTTTNTSGVNIKGYRISSSNPGLIVFSAPAVSAAENGGIATITASRIIGTSGKVEATYVVAGGGTAVAGTHFANLMPTTLTWEDGDTNDKTISISISNNEVFEGDKTLELELVPIDGAALGDPATTVLTIVDDETSAGTIALTSSAYSVNENDGTVTVTATRTGGSSGPVSVSYATTAGSTATAWSDFVPASGSLNWADGETGSKTFSITIYDDTKVEGTYPDWNEKVNLAISNPTNGALLGIPNLAVLTISDEEAASADQGVVSLSASTYNVLENVDPYTAGSVTITVHRTRGNNGPVSVNYAATGGTALAGSDYPALSGTLSWADGDWYDKSFTIDMLNNYVYEGNETINLAITAPTNPTLLGSPNTAVVTIDDEDDHYGVIALTSATYLVDEDGPTGKATITATRTNGANGLVSVSYAKVNGGTATVGTDYTNFSGTLSWANRDTASKSFEITIVNDVATDANETVKLALSGPTGGASLGTPNTATLTINDDEGKPGSIVLTAANYSVNENDATGKIIISAYRFGGSSGAVSVDFATTADSAPATLFDANFGTLNWGAGQSGYQTFEILIHDNALYEGNETVNITLSNPTNGATLGAPSSAVLTIVDNDSNFVFSSSTYSNKEGANPTNITVRRLGSSTAAVSVNYTTSTGGTATEVSDFTPQTGTITWPANNHDDKTFSISVIDDSDPEESETVHIVLASPTPAGSTSLLAPNTAILTIADNDHHGVIAFKAATYAVDENDPSRSVRIVATRTGGSDGAVGVSCGLTGGTATLNTDYSTNFSQGLGTLSWADGDSADKSYEIGVYPDNTWEGSGAETVTLALSSPTGGAVVGSPDTTVLTIDDREDWPGTFALTSSAYMVAEDGGSATITASRTGGFNGAVSVSYHTYNGGTATAAVDYTYTSGFLVWPAGDTSDKTFTIPIIDNGGSGPDKTVFLQLTGINYGGGTLGGQNTAVLTIVDDEGKNGTISLSSPTYTVAEDGVTATITATRSGGSTGTVSVDYATTGGGTATVEADYTSTSGTHTWANGESGSWSFTVPIRTDLLDEGDETFNVSLTNPSGGAILGTAAAAVTIEGPAVKELDHWPATPQLTSVGAVDFTVSAGHNRLLMVAINASGASGATATGQTFSATYGGIPLIQAALHNTNAYAQTWIGYLPEAGILARSGDSLSISVNGGVNGVSAYIASYENVNQDYPVAASGGTYSRTSGSYITPTPLPVGAGGYAIFNWAQPQYLTMTWSSVTEGYASDANFYVNGRRTGIASKSFATATQTWPIVYANPYYYVSYSLVTLNKFGGAGSPGAISLKDSAWSVSETGGPVTITVKRTGGYNGPVQVNHDVVGGTGVDGLDYRGGAGTLAWADNDMADKTFTIEILDNGVYSVGKTINLALSAPTGGATLGNPSTGVVTIVNDDPMVQGSVAFSSPTYTVNEDGSVASIIVSRTGGIDGAVGVHYATVFGMATWGVGGDYMATSGTLSWADGDGADKVIDVTILDDLDDDGDKTVDLTLASPTGGVVLGSPDTAVLTIVDNEAPPATIALTSSTFSVNENGGPAQITVRRSGNSVGEVRVHCETVRTGGTATSGSTHEYQNRGSDLVWADGDMADKSFDITIYDNLEYGIDKTVTMDILQYIWSGNAVFGTPRSMTLTIVNDDPFLDADGDLVEDRFDLCPNTPAAQSVDANGCALSQLDSDGDSVTDDLDQCPATAGGQPVNANGCDDTDQDGLTDSLDLCPATPNGEAVNGNGCGLSQLDSDADGVSDLADQCPGTGVGLTVDVNGCTVAAGYLLPDSGQTNSFTTAFGEDHDYPIHPLSYNVVGETVVDNNTGLIWQQQDDNVKRNWADAITYCNELPLAGQTDWRLPTRAELSSILDMGRQSPAIDPVFVGTNFAATDRYWSSTPTAAYAAAAWSGNYYQSGGDSWMQQKTSTYYVRCVRGGV